MTVREAPAGVLLQAFADFHRVLVEVRDEVKGDPWAASARLGTAAEAEAGETAAGWVRNRLTLFLHEQERTLGAEWGDPLNRQLDRARYVMASLADEVFLSFEWEGRRAWMSRLLETQLYGTHVAGERIFDEIEELLQDRQDAERELAHVYLLALSLGFEGRYRGSSDPRPLHDVRERLLTFVQRGAPSLDDPRRSLATQPYAHTLTRDIDALLPPTRRWLFALVLAVGVYLVVAHLLWQDVAGPLRAVTDSFEQMQEMAR